MTRDQFRQLAETWGGDIDRWPVATQAAARGIAASADGAAILEAQRGFDRLFATAPDIGNARAGQAGLAVLQRLARAQAVLPWYRRLWQPGSMVPVTGLACSLLVGVWLASALPYHPSDEGMSLVSMLFDSSVISPWGVQ
ncbi:hypothetical protein [Rhodopseudomonas sp. P2A-2r]|uniref:hypothetical protein n=1 Tax=unclassified Rhodopseudomonas TaxID=2638247 RepID=UPI00223401EB|nr:hypothetical protein [Rhodopseudomonas sp. P2A-2r]UZE48396.1 hypothetical protein ONR75_26920 [Rhodopseudomonas sp. P2A-2r]